MTGVSGTFGVEPFHSVNGGRETMPDPKGSKTYHGHEAKGMHDGERGIGEHVGRGAGSMPAQRHPDHGPHFHQGESFGTTSLRKAQQG